MSLPPQTTVIFKGLPGDTENWLVGIDTKFFTVNQLLRGLKLVPGGIHLIHYSIPWKSDETTESSVRYGRFIECKNEVVILSWNLQQEKFDFIDGSNEEEALNYSKSMADLGEDYRFTVEYPEDFNLWSRLISKLDMDLIQEFVPYTHQRFTDEINTITPSKEENMVLLDQLQQKDPIRTYEDHNNSEFAYTIIEFRKNRPDKAQDVTQITKDFRDKSWYLDSVFGHDLDILLGEFQLSFVLFVVLGNFCSGLQWLNILRLVLMSKTFLGSHKAFTHSFILIFKLQLETIPAEYVGDTISLTSAVDTKTFIDIMENFVRDVFVKEDWTGECCGKMKMNGMILETWENILETINSKFNLDIKRLGDVKVDENQFEVYDLKDYDENDEDAPAIV